MTMSIEFGEMEQTWEIEVWINGTALIHPCPGRDESWSADVHRWLAGIVEELRKRGPR